MNFIANRQVCDIGRWIAGPRRTLAASVLLPGESL